jgi:hypothetical protein
MQHHPLWKRTAASLLSVSIIAATTPPVGAAPTVYGKVQTAGTAWVGAGDSDWSSLTSTRPLVAGDRIKTADNGHVVADLGARGTIGMFGGAEIAATDDDTIDVAGGKVAFRLGDDSDLRIDAGQATIRSDRSAHGYVEKSASRTAITAEVGSLMVASASGERRLDAGQRLIVETGQVEPVQLAGAYGAPEEPEEMPAPPPPPPAPAPMEKAAPVEKDGPNWAAILGWTALAAVVGVVIYEIADDDDDDKEMSPS